MFAKIFFAVGLILAIIAIINIFQKQPIGLPGKIITSILMIICPWLGVIVYYLYAKDHLAEWFK